MDVIYLWFGMSQFYDQLSYIQDNMLYLEYSNLSLVMESRIIAMAQLSDKM